MSDSSGGLSGTFADRYTIERELGRGGSSIVYLARDTGRAQLVALKVLRQEFTESIIAERFLREIRLTSALEHPRIVPVLDSGETGGRLYCVLPHMEGESLRARLRREKQLPLGDVLALGRAICEALEFAHANNVIHRDVKPENILLSGGEPRLADFGIARALVQASGDWKSTTGVIRGTPAYMSPEQAAGERDLDGRSDIYSLACVLYECAAGVPAFIAATPEQVLAQRFEHAPRALHVYRPSVPEELEAVLDKAFAIAPADRYQTAAEFGEALAGVEAALGHLRGARSGARAALVRSRTRAMRWGVGTVGILVTALAAGELMRREVVPSPFSPRFPAGDTALVAILPFEDAPSPLGELRGEDLLFEGMRRWPGLSLVGSFEVADAVRRRGKVVTSEDARAIAASVGAGRYVRARFVRTGVGLAVHATLYDVGSGREVHQARMDAPPESSQVLAAYTTLADSLVLLGARIDPRTGRSGRIATLPAAQTFIRGQRALNEWDLGRADSLFSRASELDPTFSRAHLWAAQARSWRGLPPASWLGPATIAMRDTAELSQTEQKMATGLAALAEQKFDQACSDYRLLTVANPLDFTGWYGLGQCRDLDRVVIPDAASPLGWRFRSSYQEAVRAYQKAFELLPSSYVGFEADAFARLRRLLYTSGRLLRQGVSAGANPLYFSASPSLNRDTLVFVPFPSGPLPPGTRRTDLGETARAVEKMRGVFRRITTSWATAFPTSPGTKEAFALALEMNGDPAAIDSLRSARRLASDPLQRLRLAVAEVFAMVKFGLPDQVAELERARIQADSLLRFRRPESPAEAELLSRVAALTGRCAEASTLAAQAAEPMSGLHVVPRFVVANAHSLLAYVALGCEPPDSIPTLVKLASQLDVRGGSEPTRIQRERAVLGPIVFSVFPPDSVWVLRLAQPGLYRADAERALLLGNRDLARTLLESLTVRRRRAVRGEATPDAVLREARLWLAIGDTLEAVHALGTTFSDLRLSPALEVGETAANLRFAASLVRAAALLAALTSNDRPLARRWSRAVVALWQGADGQLQALMRRMRELART